MTNPTPDHQAVVDALVARLRELQATGESELIGRRITAGPGLAGGGTLADDVTLRLSQSSLDNLARAERSVSESALNERLGGYVTEQAVADALADYLRRQDGYRIVVLPFSHPGTVVGTVAAPPVLATGPGVIESIGVSVAEAGADLTVTVAGRSYSLPAGETGRVFEHGGPVTKGGPISLSLASTGVRGVTVAVRIREAV